MNHYATIAKALLFAEEHYREQPSLEIIAKEVGLSPFHLQRIFTKWAGVSPKKFLQYLSVEHAKTLLQNPEVSLQTAANKTGLSGTSRLHDLFITIEGMTPGEYKNGGVGVEIFYVFQKCRFGNYLVAATSKGICNIIFFDQEKAGAEKELRLLWSQAKLRQKKTTYHQAVQAFFDGEAEKLRHGIKLHLRGTPFQLKVWAALLTIPEGTVRSYSTVAAAVDCPTAQRAVGSAMGDNPVAYLIPCHRVIKSSGVIGQYRWGPGRKLAMLGWEAARREAK